MKRILTVLAVTLVGFGLAMIDADAKRLGGGSNIGSQRSPNTMQRSAPQQPAQAPGQKAAPATAPAPAAAPAGASRWLGPLAGLAAGGLLGAMLFGHGFDGMKMMDFVMILLLAGAIFFVWRMLRRPQPEAPTRAEPMRYAGVGAEPVMRPEPAPYTANALSQAQSAPYPAGFDADEFARHARINFVKLQAANDARDMPTLRDFMTPELFAEISAQIRARGEAPQKTEVVTLNAEVIDVVTEGEQYIASVRFSGLIKETADGEAEALSEVWHLEKPVSGKSGWLIAGIQQG